MLKGRVVVGLSGGVDSSVSAYLLKEAGYDVIGLFMKNWEDDDDSEYCSSRQDLIDATAVADVIGIDIEAVNFAKEYKERVFAEFLDEYKAGRTPNPDVLCNSEIKFKAFLEHAIKLGADKIATGHYARVKEVNGHYQLLKGLDPNKDQSYFLNRLNQYQLSKSIFPVGEMLKTQVRKIADQIGLPNARKKDSTGICFIGERPFREFLQRYLSNKPGPILTDTGKEVGKHIGLSYYTLGQRKGIGVGGSKDGNGEPWFVAKKDLKNNTLYIVQGHNHPWLSSHELTAVRVNWISGEPAQVGEHLCVKTRYRMADEPCVLVSADMDRFKLTSENPLWAVTPGQSAVLYQGDICLGGAIIK